MLDSLRDLPRDFRFALRSARRRPLLAAIVVLTLALGIGATTAVFSIADRVLLRPLPYAEPEQLVNVGVTLADRPDERTSLAAAVLTRLAAETRSMRALAAATGAQLVVTTPDGPVAMSGAQLSANFFQLLGSAPLVGHGFTPYTLGQRPPSEIVLAHSTWQTSFGGDPAVIGRSVLVGTVPHIVVGVMPAEFIYPMGTPDAWVPLDLTPFLEHEERSRRQRWFMTIGRVAPGSTLAQVQSELSVLSARLATEHPLYHANERLIVRPLRDQIVGNVQAQVRVLMGAALVLLIIACANGAGVLVAQVLTRQHEFAVQVALGAARARLARQLIAESLVLALAGGALGLLLAHYGTMGLHAATAQFLPSVGAPAIDARIVAVSIVACVVCGLVLGAVPTALVGRGALGSVLRSYGRSGTGGRGGARARGVLVVVQTSLCVALLVSAGLLGRMLLTLQRADLGFDTSGALVFELSLPRARYASDTVQNQFYEGLERTLRAIPGVTGVATANGMPMAGGTRASLGVFGRPAPDGRLPEVAYYSVSEEYFDVLRVPLRRGRMLDMRGGAREVVINETMARHHWPNGDAIGARVRLGPVQTGPWIEVVGIVADMRDLGPADSVRAIAFGSNRTFSWSGRAVLLRSSGDPLQHVSAVRRAVASLDPTLPIIRLRTYDEIRRADLARERLNTMLLGVFSAVSLLLAAVGIYGITASFVAARTREFGVRIALGASRRDVLGAAMRTGVRLTALGLVVGLGLAAAFARVLASAVHGIRTDDFAVYSAVVAVLGISTLVASWLPAHRATRVDPVTALRTE